MTAPVPPLLCDASRHVLALVEQRPGVLRATLREIVGCSYARLDGLIDRARIVVRYGQCYPPASVPATPANPPRTHEGASGAPPSVEVSRTRAKGLSDAAPEAPPAMSPGTDGATSARAASLRNLSPEGREQGRAASMERGAVSRARALDVLRAAGPSGLSGHEWAAGTGLSREYLVGTVVPRLRSAVRLGGVQSRRRYYAADVAPGELPAVDRVSALERRVAMLEAVIAAMGRE